MHILYVQYDHAEIIQKHTWWIAQIEMFGSSLLVVGYL